MQENDHAKFVVVPNRTEASPGEGAAAGTRAFVIDESVGYRVNYAAKLFARVLYACLKRHGVMPGQWGTLMHLWAHDGQPQKDLAAHTGVDDATMVRTLDRMERDGLVRRVRNARDRRQINVFLTEKGRGLCDSCIPCAIAGNEAATRDFSEAEVAQLDDFLRRMSAALERELSAQQERS